MTSLLDISNFALIESARTVLVLHCNEDISLQCDASTAIMWTDGQIDRRTNRHTDRPDDIDSLREIVCDIERFHMRSEHNISSALGKVNRSAR